MSELKQNCPLCHSHNVNEIEGIASPLYFICNQCKLIYMHDHYIIDPTAEKARYDTHNNSLANEGYVAMFERFITNAVVPFTESGSKTLDYGSGPEPVLQYLLQQKGYPTDIYDRYYAPDPVYEQKTYDLIISTETIEHVANAAELWELFSNHLRPGGRLAIMTLFHPGTVQFPRWWYRRDPTHIRFYHPDTYAWICSHYSFKILWRDEKNSICLAKL